MNDDILLSEVGNLNPHQRVVAFGDADPVDDAVVIRTGPARHVITITERKRWVARRVYSQYLSREVFTDPEGVEWVRISAQAYDPAKGDIEIEMRGLGLNNMLLRRRDFAANNLKKGV